MTPRVSVIVATRDRPDGLARALASIHAQRFREFEVIVADDSSADVSAVRQHAGPLVSVIRIPQQCGAAAARNRGIEHARGEILAFLDDDDVWHPSYLTVQVTQLDTYPRADLCTTGHVEVDPSGRVAAPDLRPVYSYPDPLMHMLAECPIHTLSVVAFRRACFDRVGLFDESLAVVHDLEWYLRLLAPGAETHRDVRGLVRRSVPGGLVTRHRQWFAEERTVHRRFFARNRIAARWQRRIRVLRALFFANIGFAREDLGFGAARLAEALVTSPLAGVRVATVKLIRRHRGIQAALPGGETEAA
jgi:glycosyltransferase involved in cell wall biosynthesis